MDYIIIISFILMSTFLIRFYALHQSKLALLFLIGLVLIVCAFRKINPLTPYNDAYEYSQFYLRAFGNSFREYLSVMQSSEVLFYGFFWICSKLELSYVTVRMIYYMIMLFLTLKIEKEINFERSSYVDHIFLFTNFVLADCLMRNCFAYVVGWYSIALFLNKKNIKAFLCALVSVFIHSSGIIMVAFIVFALVIQNIKKLSTAVLFTVVFYGLIINIFPALLRYLGDENEKISYYMATTTGSFAITTSTIRILILLMLLILYNVRNHFKYDEKYKQVLLICLFSLSITLMQLVFGIAYRFLYYFEILNMIAFGYIRSTPCELKIGIEDYEVKNVVMSFICIMVLVLFIRRSLTGYGLIPITW